MEAEGDAPIEYRWRRDGVDLADGGNVLGSATASLTVFASDADIGLYDCVVTNANGGTESQAAILGLRPSPCPADFTDDAVLNFFDVQAFLQAFSEGCP